MLFFNFAWKPMPPFWDCLKILMGTFTIFWLSWTDSFRIQQIDSFRFLGQIFTPVGNSAMEIPKWIGSSDIDCITHLQYDKLWGLPRRVFTLFIWWLARWRKGHRAGSGGINEKQHVCFELIFLAPRILFSGYKITELRATYDMGATGINTIIWPNKYVESTL